MGLFDVFRRHGPATGPPTYRNSAVVDRIAKEERVDRETAVRWFQEMLVFLDLSNGSSKSLSPPVPVDKAWQAFVLHTRDYEAYCSDRFGRVIHHQPAGEADPKAYRRAYEARSGWRHDSVDSAIWVVPAATASVRDSSSPRAGEPGGSSS